MKKINKIIIYILTILFIIGCDIDNKANSNYEDVIVSNTYYVKDSQNSSYGIQVKYFKLPNKVKCVMFKEGNSGGLSCNFSAATD